MEPKERVTWMLSIYNAQYEDYKTQAARTDLTEAQKEILREKKKVLTKVYPLIETYAEYVNVGTVPSQELETLIVSNLETLLKLL